MALSLLALATAVTIVVSRRIVQARPLPISLLLWWSVILFLLAGTRDPILYLLLAAELGFVTWFFSDAIRRTIASRRLTISRNLLLSLGCLGLATLFARWSAENAKDRWRSPLINLIFNRIVPDSRVYSLWILHYGFPGDAVISQQAGKWVWTAVPGYENIDDWLRRDPSAARLNDWINEKGRDSYQQYLWDDLSWAVSKINKDMTILINSFGERWGGGSGVTRWSQRLTAILYPRISRFHLTIGILLLLSSAAAFFHPPCRVIALAATFFLLNTWPQLFINYHGDASDGLRHVIIAAVIFRLGMVLSVLAIAQSAPPFVVRWMRALKAGMSEALKKRALIRAHPKAQ
jgi:hypothetical protein